MASTTVMQHYAFLSVCQSVHCRLVTQAESHKTFKFNVRDKIT